MDSNERSNKVDPVTENALLKMEKSIIQSVGKLIENSLKDFTDHITKVYDIKFENVEKVLEQYKGWHGKHFDATNDIDPKINEAVTTLRKEIKGNGRFKWQYALSIIAIGISLLVSLLL